MSAETKPGLERCPSCGMMPVLRETHEVTEAWNRRAVLAKAEGR